jgi:uncharacterized membrane protein YccC
LQSVLTIAVALVVEWAFVHSTHALLIESHGGGLPATEAAKVAIANHGIMVIAMLLGGIIGLISTFGVTDATAPGQLVTLVLMPIPFVAALSFGLAVGGHRTLALVCLTLIIAVGTYCRRFGPRGFMAGILLFTGDFIGFFVHAAVPIHDVGWLVAEVGIGLGTAIAVRFVFFYPRPARALERTQRSYDARARKVAALTLTVFDDGEHSERDVRRLHRQLVRLNEAALIIDAQLGDPASVTEGSSAELLHQRLFDAELALTNVARFALAMGHLGLPDDQRSEARSALLAVVRQDPVGATDHATRLCDLLRAAESPLSGEDATSVAIVHRFTGSVIALADATSEWLALGVTDVDDTQFQSPVVLLGGWLPGSAHVSAAASRESGVHWRDAVRLAPYTRAAIQVGVAVGAAIVLGDLLSERRFYWAVLAAFVTFMGAHTSSEQALKALNRVVGTVIGIAIGSLLVNAVGHHPYWSVVVILASLFLGMYLLRVNYALLVVGVTVTVSQLYSQLGEFSNSLLLLRLEETAIGAAVAVAVVMLVVPLRTRRVLRIAYREYIRAMAGLVDRAASSMTWAEHDTGGTLRADARAVDVSYQALVATAQPVRRNITSSDQKMSEAMRLATASRHYTRDLVAAVGTIAPLDQETSRDIERASATLHRSLEMIAAALNGPRGGVYTRSSSLFDRAERRLEARPAAIDEDRIAIRDFKLIDGTMAKVAELIGLGITDYDTSQVIR